MIYGFLFEFDNDKLAEHSKVISENGLNYLREFFKDRGFIEKSPNLYFSGECDESIHVAYCIIMIQRAAKEFSWFKPCLLNITLLRISEQTDLNPAFILM